jgi:hypothetical protein
MQDLKSRLKKEMCKDLEEIQKLYPTTYEKIMNALKNEEFVTELKYDIVLDIETYLYDYNKTGKPCDIFEMFEKYKD